MSTQTVSETNTTDSRVSSPAHSKLAFAFDGEAGKVLERHFLADAANAKLSQKFKLYYRLRPWIPIAVRQWLQGSRNSGMQVADDWFLPHPFMEDFKAAVEADLAADRERTVVHPWPNDFRFAVSLTHDVETKDGVALVDGLAKLEESYGFRSSWNFVPHKYAVDPELIRDLKARGHEIGVHGYNHDGRLFFSRAGFQRRAKKINEALDRYESNGFRAPMVHRNLEWISDLNVDYDASCFDVDPFQAMPGGIGGCWPFLYGDMVELPYTLPQDHTLLVTLGERSANIWLRKLEFLRKWSGMAMLITHPDYLDTPKRLAVYEQLLQHLAEVRDAWFALPSEIAQWWFERGEGVSDRSRCVRLDELFHV